MKNYAIRIKKYRERKGLTQQELADAIGAKSRSTISMYESGKREPDLETLELIAKALDVTPGHITSWLVVDHTLASHEMTEEDKQYEDEMYRLYWQDLEKERQLETEENERYWMDQPKETIDNSAHMAYRERLRREPGTRMLLDVTEDATPEEMQQYVDVIKALRKQYDDE